jgi:hypothetical protein
MTEPRTPDDRSIDPGATPPPADAAAESAPSPAVPPSTDPADSPTQAWPSLATPAAATPASAPPLASAPRTGSADPVAAASPYEPAPSLPATRVGAVGETGTFGASGAPAAGGGRSRVRWALALVGVLIVAVGSFAIVSLVGGRPSTSPAIGYMPANLLTYQEIRLDLPGDQRAKLAAFLQAFPGFKDQSAIEPKIDEVFDRIVKAASQDKQTWTADIKPWFGGQVAVGAGTPDALASTTADMAGMNSSLVALTVSDRAKAIAWLTKAAGDLKLTQTKYGDADLFEAGASKLAVAVNDKVMLGGSTASVKAAIDTGGKGTFAQNDDVKAALATLDSDYVLFGVTRTRLYADVMVKTFSTAQPGVLEKTQIDETLLAMVPAWQAVTARFENDAIVATTVGPSWAIGTDSANRTSQLVGHVPAKSLFYVDIHDVGPNLTALLAKFRGLEEAKPVFAQLDQALNLLGGADAVYGWWGDSALVVSQLGDGTIGGGLVIHPTDAAKATSLFATLNSFLALGGSSAGVSTRTEDHNGTKITIIDFSQTPGVSTTGLPPGYKPEVAWASNADVAVVGYGSTFVKEVLDAGPGKSLGDDARFKGLLGRVGAENIGVTFVDIAAIRALIEPLAQAQAPADVWTHYTTEIQPYLKPLDAIISNTRKDNGLDRGSGAFTVH